MVAEETGHLFLFHYFDLAVAVLTAVLALYILRTFHKHSLSIITSRLFLKKERFAVFLKRFVIFILVSAGAMAVLHGIQIMEIAHIYADPLHAVSMIGLLGAVAVTFNLFRDITIKSPE